MAILGGLTLKRMDNVGVVVDDLAGAVAFFKELGMELEGEAHVELTKFRSPMADSVFAVEDIDDVVARLRTHGAALVGELVQYENYRLCYVRGPEGILIALAEERG